VDGAVMTTTEQCQVFQRGRAALHPMAHVMPFPDAQAASREAAAPVSVLQGPSHRRFCEQGQRVGLLLGSGRRRRPGAPHREEPCPGLRGGDACEGAHLGIG
jgi:hypothetical protein